MEQTTKSRFDKSAYHPVVFKSYKVTKKLIKYGFYLALIYFACEGFMAWD